MSGEPKPLPFATQRLVALALLLAMLLFGGVTFAVWHGNGGKGLGEQPEPGLDAAAIAVGIASVLGAAVMRMVLGRAVANATGAARSHARFGATLVPLAILEGSCLFGLTIWLLNGNPVPGGIVAGAAFAIAVAMVPLHDPDEGRS